MKPSDFYSKELIDACNPQPEYIVYDGCLYKLISRNVDSLSKSSECIRDKLLNIMREGEATDIGRQITIERIYDLVKGVE